SGKGRVAAYEIMIMTPAISNLIRERKTNRILSSIQTGTKLGMISMDQSLLNLYNAGKITGEDALARAANVEELRQRMLG
ncbi:MAG: type IV pili twitching motility protein PilT, partial [Candidatus Omnitrophica bacterium]|nr:type IV pili twitching motility protein PilT [Candidatus Omnitrophota bacterium]